ncbi:MAG: Rpn family recombination-promoting nuclease/putative transposase [Acetatifactor sp.]|nr:Rpn family recombination-promoting nuclease/putative transposase [Acetatifactor sp.]
MSRKIIQGSFLPPKSDLVFKELMRNETVRRHFIGNVLGIPLEEIRSIRLETTFLSRRSRLEKQCILDVRMQLNDNSRINVELQIRRMDHWDKRSLFYLSKMYTDGLVSGQRYNRLKKCIVINILDFSADEHPGYHKVYQLRDEEGRKYSDQFEIHIIELNKELSGDRADDWVRLFRIESREELEMLQSKNPGVLEAIKEVKVMNLSRLVKAWYEARQRDQRDRWAFEDTARNEGRAEGILEGKTEGETIGDLKRSRQAILDLLEELGDIPEDIHNRILAEVDIEVLRKWLKAAAKTTDFDAFRGKMV